MTFSMTRRTHRLLAPLVMVLGLLFAAPALAACSNEGSKTDCSTNKCTITLDRGADASASVLGVKVKLIKVEGDMVTLEVAGQRVTVPKGDPTESGGNTIEVKKITDDNVVIDIAIG